MQEKGDFPFLIRLIAMFIRRFRQKAAFSLKGKFSFSAVLQKSPYFSEIVLHPLLFCLFPVCTPTFSAFPPSIIVPFFEHLHAIVEITIEKCILRSVRPVAVTVAVATDFCCATLHFLGLF